jgi:hypothetical protein
MTINTAYDAIFQQAAQDSRVPFDYLRSLAKYESNFKPDAIGPGQERGLLQIAKVTLSTYNRVTGKKLTPVQSADPLVNAQIAVWLIERIVKSFFDNHPLTLAEDWNSARYVGLVTQAYNAGESESKGVGALVGKLEKQGIEPERITYKTVAQANETLKINPWLSDAGRIGYVGRVVNDFFANRPALTSPPVASAPAYPDLPVASAEEKPSETINLPPMDIPIGMPEETDSKKELSPPTWTEYLVLGALGGGLIWALTNKQRTKHPHRISTAVPAHYAVR